MHDWARTSEGGKMTNMGDTAGCMQYIAAGMGKCTTAVCCAVLLNRLENVFTWEGT